MAFYEKMPALPGDGLRADGVDDLRAVRGGGFSTVAKSARSAHRFGVHPANRTGTIGVRPALEVGRP
jgi:hypothetical protein